MKFNGRKVIRKSGYNYSFSGCYFITICSKEKKFIFGDIKERKMYLNEVGKLTKLEILRLNNEKDVDVVKFVIMPNHVHLLIFLKSDANCFIERKGKKLEDVRVLAEARIPKIIQQFKSRVSRCVGTSIWHSRYHDHIVRNQREYKMIYNYIENNPMNWDKDCYR
ncbi:MAG: transposase [Clostridia bacterium]|nr:transposase [Clostridia bacterium]